MSRSKMTKKDAIAQFNEFLPRDTFITPSTYGNTVKYTLDKTMRAQAWNDFVDGLQKDRMISKHQASTWTHPWRD